VVQAVAEREGTGSFRGELACRYPDNTVFPADIWTTIFTGADGQRYTTISIRDLSARKAAEAARERPTQKVTDRLQTRIALLAVAEWLAAEINHQRLLAEFATPAVRIAGADHSECLRRSPEDRTLTTVSSSDPVALVGRVQREYHGLNGLAAVRREPVIVDDDALAMAHQPTAGGHAKEVRAAAAVPLLHGGAGDVSKLATSSASAMTRCLSRGTGGGLSSSSSRWSSTAFVRPTSRSVDESPSSFSS